MASTGQASPESRSLAPTVARQKRAIYALSLVVASFVIAFGAWGIKTTGVFGAKTQTAPQSALQAVSQNSGPAMLQSKVTSNGPSLMASSQSQPPAVLESQPSAPSQPALAASEPQQPAPVMEAAPQKPVMPADIRDWLELLRITEGKREQLATNQVSQAISMLTSMVGGNLGSLGGMLDGEGAENLPRDTEAPGRIARDANAMNREWQNLSRFFNSKRAPAECQSIQRDYNQTLSETNAMIQEIVSVVASVGDNPMGAIAKLQGMVGKSSTRIDAVAEKADKGVADICAKYETDKWFSIKKDFGESTMGKLGL